MKFILMHETISKITHKHLGWPKKKKKKKMERLIQPLFSIWNYLQGESLQKLNIQSLKVCHINPHSNTWTDRTNTDTSLIMMTVMIMRRWWWWWWWEWGDDDDENEVMMMMMWWWQAYRTEILLPFNIILI